MAVFSCGHVMYNMPIASRGRRTGDAKHLSDKLYYQYVGLDGECIIRDACHANCELWEHFLHYLRVHMSEYTGTHPQPLRSDSSSGQEEGVECVSKPLMA